MHREGHVGLTLLFFSVFSYILNFWSNILLFIALIFSVIPDYDIYLTGMRKTFKILAIVSTILTIPIFLYQNFTLLIIPISLYLLYLMSEHRAFSHTLAFAILCGTFMGFFTLKVFGDFTVGFFGSFLGISSHIIGDLLTYKPFSPLYPFYKRKIAFKFIKSSNPIANKFLLISGLIALIILYKGGTILRCAIDLIR